jgi:uncharacterized coiled-coil protein SlyX
MEPQEQLPPRNLRNVLERGSPYISWGNAITLVGLVMAALTGNLNTGTAAADSGVSHQLQTRVDEHDVRLARQESATAELYRAVERQDATIAGMQQRTDAQLREINGKVDRLLELMIEDSRKGQR